MEWVHLIQEAKKIGLTIEEVKFFLSRKTTSFRKD
ncbi:anti-repressor SinI family protein [Fervidibacillus albus]|uniref:Anti-repressor SinI family protein n=2 Tax=Fervidibacillus albus TaxID=2980026 RepID=A0A9E8LX99_9BACI|nr:anti-repressor SinI family protein [Fervidibacillus albus]WAA11271.1 anti-repressor SinI family protein [Fervidibacillus albus]